MNLFQFVYRKIFFENFRKTFQKSEILSTYIIGGVLVTLTNWKNYAIIHVQYNSRKKRTTNPTTMHKMIYCCRVVLARMRGVRARIFGLIDISA